MVLDRLRVELEQLVAWGLEPASAGSSLAGRERDRSTRSIDVRRATQGDVLKLRGGIAGFCGVLLAALAMAPTAAQAAGVPQITSVVPNEVGSAGGFRIVIHGSGFEELRELRAGERALPLVIGAPRRGTCRVLSSTELECVTPFHEHGKVHVTATNAAGTSTGTSADELTFLGELYKNEVAVGAAHIPAIGYGEIQLESPQINTLIECVNLGFGAGWNGAPTGDVIPISGHGEILSWWANGHTPTAEHTELGSRCRFIYHGTFETTSQWVAWASAEPPLKLVNQEGIVCAEENEPALAECPNASEQIHETVMREVSREPPSLPWNIRLVEREGRERVQIGLADESCAIFGGELQCVGGTPIGCESPPTAPGCVKVQILSNPPLNVHMEYEGYVEPLALNAGPNGLEPSIWEFEGHAKGEPGLHLRETPATEGSTSGSMKILGYSGQELITLK